MGPLLVESLLGVHLSLSQVLSDVVFDSIEIQGELDGVSCGSGS